MPSKQVYGCPTSSPKNCGGKKEHTLNTRCKPLSFAHFLPLLMSVSITSVRNSFHETTQMPSIPQPRIACCLMVMTCSFRMKDRDSSSTNSKRKQKWAFSIPGSCCSDSRTSATSLKKSSCIHLFFPPSREDSRGLHRMVPVWGLVWDADVSGRLRCF